MRLPGNLLGRSVEVSNLRKMVFEIERMVACTEQRQRCLRQEVVRPREHMSILIINDDKPTGAPVALIMEPGFRIGTSGPSQSGFRN